MRVGWVENNCTYMQRRNARGYMQSHGVKSTMLPLHNVMQTQAGMLPFSCNPVKLLAPFSKYKQTLHAWN